MAKLERLTLPAFVRTWISLALLFVLSGCDLDSDDVFKNSNKYVHHYAQLTKEFYMNNDFDERSARAMAMLYNALFKSRYDRQINGNADMIDGIDDITLRQAKNIFACSILDSRALQAVNNKDEIIQLVNKYMSILREYPEFKKRHIENGGTEQEANAAFEEKYGEIGGPLMIDRFITITGFDKTFEACAFINIKQNYLSRPEAAQIE